MTAFAIFLFYLPVSGWSSPHLRVNCDSSIMPSYVWNVKPMPQQEIELVSMKYIRFYNYHIVIYLVNTNMYMLNVKIHS